MLSMRLQDLFDEFLCKIKEQFDNVSLTGEMAANQNQIKKVSNPSEHGYKEAEPGEMFLNQSKIKKDRNVADYGYKQAEPGAMSVKDSKMRNRDTINYAYKPNEMAEIYAKQNQLDKVRNFINYENKLEEPHLSDKQPSFLLRKKDFAPGWFSPMHSRSSELRKKYQRNPNKFDKNTNKNLEERIASMQKKIDERRRKEQFQPKLKNMQPNIERSVCKQHETDGAGFYDGNMKRCTCKNPIFYDSKMKSRLPRNKQNFKAEGSIAHPFDYRLKEDPMESFSRFTFNSTYTSSN